jgi:hypothetical protein
MPVRLLVALLQSPDIQLVIDPSFAPGESVIAVFGVRVRLVF